MRTYDYHSVEAVLIYLYPLLSIALFSLLIVAAVLAYRRMEAGTRFHPGPVSYTHLRFATDVVLNREGNHVNRVNIPILDEEANVSYYCLCKPGGRTDLSGFIKSIG